MRKKWDPIGGIGMYVLRRGAPPSSVYPSLAPIKDHSYGLFIVIATY